MSTLNTVNITNGTDSITVEGAVKGSAKAWVNFNGTGTVAIRASFNVSSITDNGTGNYTVNFTTAMADAAYSALGNVGRSYSSTNGIGRDVCLDRYATTSIGVSVGESQTYVLSDEPVISISVFR